MNNKGLLATAAMTAGLAIGLAANVNAAPVSDDFWECVTDHTHRSLTAPAGFFDEAHTQAGDHVGFQAGVVQLRCRHGDAV